MLFLFASIEVRQWITYLFQVSQLYAPFLSIAVQIKVRMKNMETGNWWMFDKNDFINRKYMMQDMYQNYMDGDKDWDVVKVMVSFLCFRYKG